MGKRFELDGADKAADKSLELKKRPKAQAKDQAPAQTQAPIRDQAPAQAADKDHQARRFDLETDRPAHVLDQPLLFSRKATATLLACLAIMGLLLVTVGMMTGYKLGSQQRQRASELFTSLHGGGSGVTDPSRTVVAPLPEAGDTAAHDQDQDQAQGQAESMDAAEAGDQEGGQEAQVDWTGFTGDMVESPEEAGAPETFPLTVYTVQVGAFAVAANAQDTENKLKAKGYEAFTYVDSGGNRTMYYVRFGEYQTREEADAAAAAFESAEDAGAIVMVDESRRRTEDPIGSTAFSVQVGSFPDAGSAELHARDLAARGLSPCVIRMFGSDGRTWFDVQLAQFSTREEAEAFALDFRDREGIPSNVRALDMGLLQERKTCLQ